VQRTELVLVLREALYRLCELNLNGVLDNGEAKNAFDNVLDTTRLLGQRDNVGRVANLLSKENLAPEARESLAKVLVGLTLGDVAAHSSNETFSNAAFLSAVKLLSGADDEGLFEESDKSSAPNEKDQGKTKEKLEKPKPKPTPPSSPTPPVPIPPKNP
jgi:hypothetical protein